MVLPGFPGDFLLKIRAGWARLFAWGGVSPLRVATGGDASWRLKSSSPPLTRPPRIDGATTLWVGRRGSGFWCWVLAGLRPTAWGVHDGGESGSLGGMKDFELYQQILGLV